MPNAVAFIIGLLTLLGAIRDWDWFFNHPRARLFVNWFGREGARTFYGVLGIVIMVMSACI